MNTKETKKTVQERKYDLVINRGEEEGFEVRSLDRKEFLRETSQLLKRPKRIFLGMGDFLEIGDYNILMDTIFFNTEGVRFENILDKSNRKISEELGIPISFFKLAVYYPDFLLKQVPAFCVSTIGRKARLFPGAETFVKYIKEYDPIVLSALPWQIAVEIIRRVDLNDRNLISTEYRTEKINGKREIFSGDIVSFISGDRKSLEIEKIMHAEDLSEEEVVYIGRGEAGTKTFSTVNSIAFNPSEAVIPESRITIYGSSLESLLVLFNFDGELDKFLSADAVEEYLPPLVVFSESRGKSRELVEMELQQRHLQSNIMGQRIEHSGESFMSVEREIEVAFGGSFINIQEVRDMVGKRMEKYRDNPQTLVKEIYRIARERYKRTGSAFSPQQ